MVKLIKGITPLDALNNNVQLLLNKGNLTTTNYPLDVASGIKLESGQTYAMQVIAQSPTAFFKNAGKSEVTVFTYGVKQADPSLFKLITAKPNQGFTDMKDLDFTWSFLDKSDLTDEERAKKEWRGYKYAIQINKVLSDAEEVERKAKSKQDQVKMDAANVIILNVKTETLSFNSAMAEFLKPGNNYEWKITHFATGTLSETRMFTIKNNNVIGDYTIELNGKLKYNFRDNFLSASTKIKEAAQKGKAAGKTAGKTGNPVVLTEAEKGFDLAKKYLHVLKVRLLAKMITTKDSVVVMENNVKVKHFTTTITPQILSNLNDYPTAYRDITNAPTVAYAVTDNEGNFTVNVPIKKSGFGVIDSFAYTKGDETYALVEGLVVKVNDPGFTDPGWFIVPNINKPKVIMDEAIVQIIDYKLNVSFDKSSPSNFKGKLYLLKSHIELINGEADNLKGQSKNVTYVNKNKQIIPKNYNMVGSRSVDYVISNRGKDESWVFNNLVPQQGYSDNYTVYFEPEDERNSLFFSLKSVKFEIPKKTGFGFSYVDKALETSTTLGPQFISMRISGRYLYKWKDQGKAAVNPKLPLPEGTKLILKKGKPEMVATGSSGLLSEENVAFTTVGKNGVFTFDLGLLNYNDFNKESKSLVIIVDNPYYYSQPKLINYNEGKDVEVGDLLGTVKQFKLNVLTGDKDKNDGTIKGIKGLNVYLCRKKNAPKPLGFPDTDGDLEHKTYFKTSWTPPDGQEYEIIDKSQSNEGGYVFLKKGEVSFSRLVMPDVKDGTQVQEYDYFIVAEPKSDNPYNYITSSVYPLSAKCRVLNTSSLEKAKKYFSNDNYVETFHHIGKPQYVRVVPLRPIIDGAVYPHSNASTTAISGVTIELYDMTGLEFVDNWYFKGIVSKGKEVKPDTTIINGTNGRFLFDKFTFGDKTGWKMLKLSKKGFITTYYPVNTSKPLKTGDRANLGKIFLELPLEFSANVVNQNRESVGARIIVGEDFSWADTKLFGGKWDPASQKIVGGSQQANLTSPKGKITLTIIPNDKTAYKTTVVTRTINNNNDVVEALVVKRNQHIVEVTCINTETNEPLEADVYLANKSITSEQTHTDDFKYGGKKTMLSFVAAGTQFDLRVIPRGNFTIAKTQVHSDMSGIVFTTVYVSPAVTIRTTAAILEKATGKGKKGKQDFKDQIEENAEQRDNAKQTPTSSYSVSVTNYDDDEYSIREGKNGYEISRLPLNGVALVSGNKTGYIGDNKVVPPNSAEATGVEFLFRKLPENLEENLYNFPIKLSSAVAIGGGKYKITGSLNPLGDESKSKLRPSEPNNWLTFYEVIIEPKHMGNAVLSEVAFLENELKAKLHTNYQVNIVDEQGLKITPEGNGGSIMGRVQLDPASLAAGLKTSQSNNEGDENFLYLNKQESDYAKTYINKKIYTDYMRTFSTATSDMLNQPLLVTTSSKRKVSFTAADDLTISPDEKLMLTNTGMNFKGFVETDLKNVDSKNKNIKASATFKIDHNGYTSVDEQPVNIGLKKWQLQIEKWKLNKNGFTASQGYLNALGLTIPFSNLPITHSQIGYGNFDVSKLRLLNAFDITLEPNNVITSFGFDKGYSKEKGAWSVSILPKTVITSLASLNGLPDLAATDKIEISNINLYDTDNPADTRILLKQDQPALTLNNIAKFSPGTVSGGIDYISFKGGLDLNVPNLSGLKTESYELVYKVIDGKFQHDTTSVFKGLTLDANGIFVTFSDYGQRFSNNELLLKGVLTDKDRNGQGKYNINVELTKTEEGTMLRVPQNQDKKEVVYMGDAKTTYLDNVEGSMNVTGGVWDNFKFEGDLVTPPGKDSKTGEVIPPAVDKDKSHLSFTVKGDIVADNAKVGVENMGDKDKGVSGLSLTYDFKEKALVGSCHIEQETDFANIISDVEMFIGGSKFYIFCNGVANDIKSSPISQAAFGMMVGSAELSPGQLNSLHKHFKSEVPEFFDAAVKRVDGVLFIVSIDVPIPIIPTFDIDLRPVAHAELKHGIYGNIYFKANFSKQKEDLALTIGGTLGGWVKVGAGASMGLACASIALFADIHTNVQGTLKPWGEPKIELDMLLMFTFKGEAYVGAGVCNSSCETPCADVGFGEICSPIPCTKVGLEKTLELKVSAEMTEHKVQLKTDSK
ncbi:MAG: hypothetical protein WKF91_03955 [Segetibacter sp.]